MTSLRLGLIGDNIARSQSPRLHRLAGQICGLPVEYDSLIPDVEGKSFDAVFEACRRGGYRGVNVTFPYKEQVVTRLAVADAHTRKLGACNTVVFGETTPSGHNTDYTGFRSAFRERFGPASPGIVAMVGAGGVGKAIGFALADLGAAELRIFDLSAERAGALRASLAASAPEMRVVLAASADEAANGADGLINCTPRGMVGYPGSAVPPAALAGRRWAFDAVYTPVDTEFLRDAAAAGLETMSGYELFLHQGIDAFRIFTGLSVDGAALRAALAAEPEARRRAS